MVAAASPIPLDPLVLRVLEDFGLGPGDLRTYEYLLAKGPASASEVARGTHQSRGRIYAVLRRLTEMGLAQEEPVTPVQYRATPLSEVLASAIERLKQHGAALEEARRGAAGREIPQGRPDDEVLRPAAIRVYTGRRSVHALLQRYLESDIKAVTILAAGEFLPRLARQPQLLAALRTRYQRGCQIQIHHPGSTRLERSGIERAVGPGVLRPTSTGSGTIVWVVTDQATLAIRAQPDDSAPSNGEDVAIVVANAAWAESMKAMIDQLTARPELHAAQTAPWAPALLQRLLEATREARRQVDVLAGTGWAQLVRREWQTLVQVQLALRQRGIRLRAVLAHDAPPDDMLSPLAKLVDIRLSKDVAAWLLVVDGREAFVAFPGREHGPLRGPFDTKEPHEAAFYAQVFEKARQHAEPYEEQKAAAPA